MYTLFIRILVKHIPFMKVAFADVVEWHIHHEFYEEMGKKSNVVKCGRTMHRICIYIVMYVQGLMQEDRI